MDAYDDSNNGNGESNMRSFDRETVFPNASLYHHSVMMNVDRSLGQWIRRQQKNWKIKSRLVLDWTAIVSAGFGFGGLCSLLPFHLTFGVTSLMITYRGR